MFCAVFPGDPQLPTEAVIHPGLDDFKSELIEGISNAWSLAQKNVTGYEKKDHLGFFIKIEFLACIDISV